ncbi:AAA family ATPase [Pyxidicoccus parkwayensis]|uniref:AAA family ATPase n=1 Tax=Pyxidicoccus parkwayensis TaxID=2813578 RepID=A0ABX7P0D9_9BACT|nr:AAA family ATPase [Pyxidicoccus parkwaysis]QSQ21773.1 AAA family ATPase [Pyxidicoccus parkwaysis]
MLKLQWLQVHRFRAVQPGTRLTFSPSFNVLLGENGTGKTTLLDLVAAVASSDFSALRTEAFDLEYAMASDTGRITVRVRNEAGDSGSGLVMDLVVAPGDMAWPLVIHREGQQVTVSRQDDTSDVVHERIAPEVGGRLWLVLMSGGIAWVEKTGEGTAAVEPLLAMAREVSAQAGLGRFDEGLAYFEQLLQVELRLSRRAEGVLATGTGLASEDLLDGLRKVAAAQWGSARYVLPADCIPFLRDSARLLGFTSAEALLAPLETQPQGKYETLSLGHLDLVFTGPGGQRVSARELGYGQKRLVAFLHYLAHARAVVVADELAHALHPRQLRAGMEQLGQRQSFLTSQSPLLLDSLRFESPEHVRATFVRCRRDEGSGAVVWEDLSPGVAEEFFTAYRAAPQRVGELLQARGLW